MEAKRDNTKCSTSKKTKTFKEEEEMLRNRNIYKRVWGPDGPEHFCFNVGVDKLFESVLTN